MNDLELVERFRSHVEPPDPERMAGARARLQSEFSGASRAGRRRGVPPLLLAAMASAPVVAAIAAVLVIGSIGQSATATANAAIIRHTDAALAPPPDKILHTEVRGGGFVAEWWQMTSPPYSFLGDKGPVGSTPEQASDATTTSYWDPSTNTIHTAPSTSPTTLSDPLAEVRQALRDGRARVLGTKELDGHPTYEIQFAEKTGFDSQSLIAYVDEHTYRPILLSDPQRDGTVVQLRVVAFEYLPETAANLRNLSLTGRHPTARVVRASSARKVGK